MGENVVSVLENILYYCERIESFKRMFGNDVEDFLNNDAYNMGAVHFHRCKLANVSKRFLNGSVPRITMSNGINSSVCDRLNGDTDNKLIVNLGKSCEEVKLPKYPKNENITAFVLSNSRSRGKTRSCVMSPSANTPSRALNKKIMRLKIKKNKK